MRILLTTLLIAAVILSGGPLSGSKITAVSAEEQRYNEIVDLMTDLGRKLCLSLARLIKNRKNFKPHRRCDLFVEAVEDLGQMTDAMVRELDMTQQEMVDTAMGFPHYSTLTNNLKNAAKKMLAKKKPSEKSVSDELGKGMSQWVLNVAVKKDSGGKGSGMGKLPRDQLKGLRHMGLKMPSQGGDTDDDDSDEENYLIDEADQKWAAYRDAMDDDDESDFEDDVDDEV